MLYEALAKVIAEMCLYIGTPLTPQRISQLLDHVINEDLLLYTCLRMVSEGKLVRFAENAYTLRSLQSQCRTSLLVSGEYQELGMTLLRTSETTVARYIPADAEHRFFEIKPSTIGGDAGLGLFVRSTRRIPQGCVLCEYSGRTLKTLPSFVEHGVYVVRVRNTSTFIDGVTIDGNHLSLATFINDNGPESANAGMMEYDLHPGRVFVVAVRDIAPGEEIFVLYGATYWGFSSYEELRQKLAKSRRHRASALASRSSASSRKRSRRHRDSNSDDEGDWNEHNFTYSCRRCRDTLVHRAAQLHQRHCGDPLVQRRLLHLDCMPMSEFTALTPAWKVISHGRNKALRRTQTFVSLADPQTFSHTHEDVVRDLEFSFEAV